MLIDRDSIKEIGTTLARNKTRTFLTAFGIFWGTLMLALLWSGGQGIKRLFQSNFEGFSSNSAIVYTRPTASPYKGYKKGMQWNLTETDMLNIRRRIPELDIVSPILQYYTSVSYRYRSSSKEQETGIWGIDPSFMDILHPVVTQGRFITDSDVAKDAKVCTIGERMAGTLFGNDNPLGKRIEINHVYFRVVGVMKQSSPMNIMGDIDNSVFLPQTTSRRLFNQGDKIDFLMLVANPAFKPAQLKEKVYKTLCQNHPLNPSDQENIRFNDISEMFEEIGKVFSGIDLLILFVGFSSLLAGIIGVGNIMWVVVKERTKEFGIRRAIGAKPKSIMAQILAESAFLTVVAGMCAIVLSVVILAVATMVIRKNLPEITPDAIDFQLSFGSGIVILLLFIILGSAAGTIPAIKAMRIKPIQALNDK